MSWLASGIRNWHVNCYIQGNDAICLSSKRDSVGYDLYTQFHCCDQIESNFFLSGEAKDVWNAKKGKY